MQLLRRALGCLLCGSLLILGCSSNPKEESAPTIASSNDLKTDSSQLVTTTTTSQASTTTSSTVVFKSCALGGVCQVGDVGPGGGVVFYVHPDGGTFSCGPALSSSCRYLEAAPTSGPSAWVDAKFIWSGKTEAAIGSDARGAKVGSGFKNTEAMVAQDGTANRAGTAAREYRGPKGLSDWYLPAKDELNELCKFALDTGQPGGGDFECSISISDPTLRGFILGDYWSSTEDSYSSAIVQSFQAGWQYSLIKKAGNILAAQVRPIRAFDSSENLEFSQGASETTSGLSCALGGVCQVGDVGPGGGVVFYVHPDGGTFSCGPALSSSCRYLEAAPTSGPSAWVDAKFIWSGKTEAAIGSDARGAKVGSGFKNTEAMVAQDGTANRAGTAAREYRGPKGLSDWYLPAKDELVLLCRSESNSQLKILVGCVGQSSDGTDGYWSSTENNGSTTWSRVGFTGAQLTLIKNLDLRVRPIRAFG